MTHQGFCWLQGCELTVMPEGSALWISKFSSFLRMFSISLPFLRNCWDRAGQKNKKSQRVWPSWVAVHQGDSQEKWEAACASGYSWGRIWISPPGTPTHVFCSHAQLEKRLWIIWRARFALLTHIPGYTGVWFQWKECDLLLLILSKSLTSASPKGREMEKWRNVVHGFTMQRNLRAGLCYLQMHFGPVLCVRIHPRAPELSWTEVWRVQRWVFGTTPTCRQIYKVMTAQCSRR